MLGSLQAIFLNLIIMENSEGGAEVVPNSSKTVLISERLPDGFVELNPPLAYGEALKAIAAANPDTFKTHLGGTLNLMGSDRNVTARMGEDGKVIAYKLD